MLGNQAAVFQVRLDRDSTMSSSHIDNGPANSAEAKKTELRMNEKKCCKCQFSISRSERALLHDCLAGLQVLGCISPT